MASSATPQIDINVLVSPTGGAAFKEWLRKVAVTALNVASTPVGQDALPLASNNGQLQLGVVIADDDTLRQLNRDYRGSDEVTDVLSFAWDHAGHWEGDSPPPHADGIPSGLEFPVPSDAPRPLGEVIASYPQAQRQARAQGRPAEEELALLLVHGILHLVGHDHLEPDQEAEMKSREREALSYLFGDK